MSSFLADVLVTAGKLEKVDLQEKTKQIQREIGKLKCAVKDFIDDNYIEFTSKFTRDQNLVMKAEKFTVEIKALQQRVNNQIKIDLYNSTKELRDLSELLKEANASFVLTTKLLSLNDCRKSIKEAKEEKKYAQVAETFRRVQSILENSGENLGDLEIYEAIAEEHRRLYASFLSDASMLWHQHIVWSSTEDEKCKTVLSINGSPEDLENLVAGLHTLNSLSDYLREFSMNLMGRIVGPLIENENAVYVVDGKAFVVETSNLAQSASYKSVLHNLRMLFNFLQRHFDITVKHGESLLATLRPYLLDDLAEALSNRCISQTVPTCSSELQDYQPVVAAIVEFHQHLISIGFTTKDEPFLPEYTKNIDELYVNRLCEDLLSRARRTMKKDLHDSFRYESREKEDRDSASTKELDKNAFHRNLYSFQEAPRFPQESLERYNDWGMEKKLSKYAYHLPDCQVSKSAREALDLAKNILEEACDGPESCAFKFFQTCRNVFELYAGLVPEHHRTFLETIPQQVALFHNNCMFLAHHLLTLAHKYQDKLPESIRERNLTFADQIVTLRSVGTESFLEHMRYQRNIIFDILKESGLSSLGQTSELHPNTERALRQCIRQLELLRTVWLDVLPEDVYCRAIGCITNSMIEDLTVRVISVEDIPADVATDLVTLFTMVVKRVPLILPDPGTINQNVPKWGKFLELIKVLGGSLKEIEVRWSNGKGPLAREFRANEAKQLIRALFQNTERRSALLAIIK